MTADWQPIETAPKDQVVWLWDGKALVLGALTTSNYAPDTWYIQGYIGRHGRVTLTSGTIEPTHWMPLPEPPKGGI